MKAFTVLDAVAIPMDIANCDTDQIIPARFLRRLPSDPDYHRYLFHDLRFDAEGRDQPDFILNQSAFRNAEIIVADINWGCGSSREGAVYALSANGIRSVIAPSFGDIHFNNCTKQGVLPVRLPAPTCDALRAALHAAPGAHLAIDLAAQTVRDTNGALHRFAISGFDKHRLLNGLDDIDLTLAHRAAVESFEESHFADYDWMSR